MNIKRIFLASLIGSLSISALIGIFVFLVGDFDELQIRILFTTLTFGVYSLTGLCAATLYEKGTYRSFAAVAIAVSAVAFLLSLVGIWGDVGEGFFKTILTSLFLAVASAHAALLLRISPKNSLVKWSLLLTNIFIASVAIMLVLLVFSLELGDVFFRLLGVVAILDVLGTIVTPLLQKFTVIDPGQSKEPQP